MDSLKAEFRGNRGMRRKQSLRLMRAVRKFWTLPDNPSDRAIGKLATTRKQCNCFSCQGQDHTKAVSSKKADAAMIDELASIL